MGIRVTMEKIDLLKKINKELNEGKTGNKENAPHIDYQSYDIKIDEKHFTVSVPLRESENFENTITTTSISSKRELKKLLREFRGFIEVKK